MRPVLLLFTLGHDFGSGLEADLGMRTVTERLFAGSSTATKKNGGLIRVDPGLAVEQIDRAFDLVRTIFRGSNSHVSHVNAPSWRDKSIARPETSGHRLPGVMRQILNRDLLGDAYAAEGGMAPFQLNNCPDEFGRGPFRAGFAPTRRGREEQAVFVIDQGFMELEQCYGLDDG